MNYQTRILPPDDWHRVPGIDEYGPLLSPEQVTVYVVERNGVLIGSLALMKAVHAEFLWIHPDYRGKASVMRRLRNVMLAEVRRLRLPTVLLAAVSDQMRRILHTMGAVLLPGDHFVLSVKE